MTHDEMIAVIQAQRDGKPVEWRAIDAKKSQWFLLATKEFDFTSWDYRVKPLEPKEMWKVVFTNYDGNEEMRYLHRWESVEILQRAYAPAFTITHYREVVKE